MPNNKLLINLTTPASPLGASHLNLPNKIRLPQGLNTQQPAARTPLWATDPSTHFVVHPQLKSVQLNAALPGTQHPSASTTPMPEAGTARLTASATSTQPAQTNSPLLTTETAGVLGKGLGIALSDIAQTLGDIGLGSLQWAQHSLSKRHQATTAQMDIVAQMTQALKHQASNTMADSPLTGFWNTLVDATAGWGRRAADATYGLPSALNQPDPKAQLDASVQFWKDAGLPTIFSTWAASSALRVAPAAPSKVAPGRQTSAAAMDTNSPSFYVDVARNVNQQIQAITRHEIPRIETQILRAEKDIHALRQSIKAGTAGDHGFSQLTHLNQQRTRLADKLAELNATVAEYRATLPQLTDKASKNQGNVRILDTSRIDR